MQFSHFLSCQFSQVNSLMSVMSCFSFFRGRDLSQMLFLFLLVFYNGIFFMMFTMDFSSSSFLKISYFLFISYKKKGCKITISLACHDIMPLFTRGYIYFLRLSFESKITISFTSSFTSSFSFHDPNLKRKKPSREKNRTRKRGSAIISLVLLGLFLFFFFPHRRFF